MVLTGLLQIFVLGLLFTSTSYASEKLRPFILAAPQSGDEAAVIASSRDKLTAAGFEVVGEYQPYAGASVIIVTSDALKKAASMSKFSGYGAAIRVSVTKGKDKVQVAYVNPAYMAAAFRMKSNLSDVSRQLQAALGSDHAFGSKKGLEDDDLRDYHYMFGMPYFDEPDVLNTFSDHKAAVEKIEANLAKKAGGVSKVFRIDIPGSDETLFGVAMSEGISGDKKIMSLIDKQALFHTAHLPYEILVSGNKAYALNARFRIAISFPDLSMGGFMGIMEAPDAIKKALTQVAGGDL
ncbi:MAG: hypothetical protein KZQ58_12895 [gamma proteobacterium symbiont of Bathyaustriella thionipta]|nr:hypothetical protein [gamma proteobacterium symbiont of Bathyaustriella thionipta]